MALHRKNEFRVLVAESNRELLDNTVQVIRRSGYSVLSASGAEQCMELLLRKKPDLILINLILHDGSGRDLCRKLKNDPAFSSILIILISYSDLSPELYSGCFDDGAYSVLEKPSNTNDLLSGINNAFREFISDAIIENDRVLLRACIDSPKDMIVVAIDKKFKYLIFNTFHKKVMFQAYNIEVTEGMNILNCITKKEDKVHARLNYGRAFSGECHSVVEEFGKYKRSIYETRYSPIYNEQNEIIGATAFSVDITERNLMEESLKKSEEKFRKAFLTSPDSVNINRLSDGMYVSVNKGFEGILGYTEEEVVGKTSVELNIWADPADRIKLVKHLIRDGEVENMEARFLCKDGKEKYGMMSASLIDLENGPHILSITRDVTDRKKMEEAINKSEENFRKAFFTSPDSINITRLDGGLFVSINEGFTKTTGYTEEDTNGKTSVDLNLWVDQKDREKLTSMLKTKGMVENLETRFRIKDGSIRAAMISASIIEIDGQPHVFSIARDISELKLAEKKLHERTIALQQELEKKRVAEIELNKSHKQLEDSKLASVNLLEDINQEMKQRKIAEAKLQNLNTELEHRVAMRTAQLEAANNELEAFAYSVSHDLRGPLRAIDGFSKFLLEDYGKSLDSEGKRLMASIRINTRKMDQLITDLLALSRVTRSEQNIIKIDMTKMSLSMFNEVASSEIKARLSLEVEELPEAYADSTYIKQVWINLISNAIKFSSPKDNPIIRIGGYQREDSNVYFVRDNGVGFNPEYTNKLFRVFQRLHRTDEFEGTGVGLAIVQRIIHRHGGKVWAEGKEDIGATFWFSLPNNSDRPDISL